MLLGLFRKPLPAGSIAPSFELPDETGNVVRLSDLRGRNVVLVFYPADDTTVCTKQLCSFRDHWGAAKAKNAVVFGVNPANAASHAKFRDRYRFPFPILVDRGQAVGDAYNSRGIVPRRTVYLIGPDGRIRYGVRGNPSPEDVLSHCGDAA